MQPSAIPTAARSLSLPGTRLWLAFLLVAASAIPARAAMPVLLEKALAGWSSDEIEDEHWAYTETTNLDVAVDTAHGNLVTVVRFDPSLPYAEQYKPVLIRGQAPTSRDLAEYRAKGEKRGRNLEQRSRDWANHPPPSDTEELLPQIATDRIAITAETPATVTYLVPLRPGARLDGNSMDHFELLFRVNKERRTVENLTMRVKEPFRAFLVVKVSGGEFSADYTRIDPALPPVMSGTRSGLQTSVLFRSVKGDGDSIRSDFQRVEPFSDRLKEIRTPARPAAR